MDNLGYKEGTPKRRLTRSISVVAKSEAEQPLVDNTNSTDRCTSMPPNPTARWRKSSDALEIVHSPAESAPNMYDSFEKPTLRISLMDQMKNAAGRIRYFEDIEQGKVIGENTKTHFQLASQIEKNLCYLWSAFLKRWDLLQSLLDIGAELNFCDQNGISALHLGAFSGCLSTLTFLVGKGMNVNFQPKCYTPLHCAAFGNSTEAAKFLINNAALITIDTNKPNCEESLLHCAVRANALECLQLFITEGADINSLKPNGTNAIHLSADLGNAQSLEILLKAPSAAGEGNVEVDLLLAKGADVKLKNDRGFTALHLAARTSSYECVELLLREGKADPNAKDFDHRTPLHAAIGKSENAFDILELLIQWGANVNHKDKYGFTALHLAALDGLAKCVEMLIYHGADVTTKSKQGTSALNVITRETPASVAMIRQKLDAAITLDRSQDPANREVEMKLDFRQLLQQNEPDSSEPDCHPPEISYLKTFVDEGQKQVLEHPLCSSFLNIKWAKIRKYYIGRLIFYFTFVMSQTIFLLSALAHNCYNGSKDDNTTTTDTKQLCQKESILGNMLRGNPLEIEMQWRILVAITVVEVFCKLFGIMGYSSFSQYLTEMDNIIEWLTILCIFFIPYHIKEAYTILFYFGAYAVLTGWFNLNTMIGQLPVFDVYVEMYETVQNEFGNLFMAYSCLLIGFTISFCAIFSSSPSFSNPFMGFISVLVMMTGEQDLSLLINKPKETDFLFFNHLLEFATQFLFLLFLFNVTIILMNLLVGIAVHDIQGLKKTAGLSILERQIKLISHIESILFNRYLPSYFRKRLYDKVLVLPQINGEVLCVKPLNPSEKHLPRDILMKAYEVGKMLKNDGHTISAKSSDAAYLSATNPYAPDDFEATILASIKSKIGDLTEEIKEHKQALITQQEIKEHKQALITQQEIKELKQALITQQEIQELKQALITQQEIKELIQALINQQEIKEHKQALITQQEIQELKQALITQQEIQELKQALITQQQEASKVMDKLLFAVSYQQKTNLRKCLSADNMDNGEVRKTAEASNGN